ncbi:23S ribosomal RNA methyltransferase Erm [Cohnella sp. REN36]|uniref:23S ribosomal RNA methyltransferase Erm n=1 Tax=Cohnella sp. REN36 TaxID=2887347 RepID=UPI001D14B807|nr:23S ribosomal RNA methyltransferase Erm [Cohnella sp. REN36]MCC3376320.1 23S ribosomal RNA methyltransferase Erm [Cohnella sp. REN36]
MRRQNKKHRTIRKCISGPNFTGQHLLHHPGTIRQLVETARLQPTDTVLEIGAGKGSLTFPLAERAARVLAVEVDAAFAETLREKAEGDPRITVLLGDIRDIRLPAKPFCVVANIPFAITTAILEKLLGPEGKGFQRGALILEKGAARRFTEETTADPRLLAWRMQFRFEMRTAIPRAHFAPPPRVDAAIVRIARRERPLVPAAESRRFAAFAAYLLRQPRLPAAEALRGVFTPAQLRPTLQLARIDREQTAVSLSPEQWASLFLAMRRHVAPYRWPKD